MWKHIAANGLSFLIVGCVVLAGLIAWGQRQYTQPGPLDEAICLEVAQGSTMRDVSRDLAGQDAVSDARIFRIGASYADLADDLKAGSFLVPEGASMAEIVGLVTASGQSTCGTEVVYRIGVTDSEMRVRELDPATKEYVKVAAFDPEEAAPEVYNRVRTAADTRYRVAVAEGATSWHIVEALKTAEFLGGKIPAVPPEGMMAPESYEVTAGSGRQALVERMVEKQRARLAAAWEARDPDIPLETKEEALILASIVEKETAVPDERPVVASVFVNRLREGMRLQTDPTVIYGITEGQGPLGRGLRQSELNEETPWNTYEIDGLPATPIANPGVASLEAAVNPAETDYLFFVADGTGGHVFAETLAEHNENVTRWRQIEAQQETQ